MYRRSIQPHALEVICSGKIIARFCLKCRHCIFFWWCYRRKYNTSLAKTERKGTLIPKIYKIYFRFCGNQYVKERAVKVANSTSLPFYNTVLHTHADIWPSSYPGIPNNCAVAGLQAEAPRTRLVVAHAKRPRMRSAADVRKTGVAKKGA
jgi:hypothetical protein